MLQSIAYSEEVAVTGLEVHVVGSRCAASGAVVEHRVLVEFACKLYHVGDAAVYQLQCMACVGYGEVSGEDGERVKQHRVVAVPFNAALLCRTVFVAEEALAGLDGGCVDLGAGRHDACRVELHFEVHSVEVELLDFNVCQGRKIAGGHRPLGNLRCYEAVYFCRCKSHYFDLLRSMRAWSSQVRIRSL